MSDENDESVLVEVRDRVLVVTLNRPSVKNVINTGITNGLRAAVERLNSSDDLTVAVLTGAGGEFCAGMDLKEFAVSGPPKGITGLLRRGAEKPMVAAIEGSALGGGLELALLCDIVVAADDAQLGLPEVRIGLFPGGGGLLRLPRRLPYGVAAEAVLTGRPLGAAEAMAHGLVARVVPRGDALSAALSIADAVAANAPLAVAASKQLMRLSGDLDEDGFWEAQVPYAQRVFRSKDAVEGPRAFAEKRKPQWSGS